MFVTAIFFGYWIVTASSPWITADDAFKTQPSASKKTMNPQCFNGVLRAGRRVPASSRKYW
jgi:hypothetical protein